MTCEISVDNYGDISPDFFTERWSKAKKQYTCDECDRPINPGDRYHYVSGKWDGEIADFHLCLDCEDIRQAIDGFPAYRTLWDEIGEQLSDIKSPQDCMNRMKRPSAKEYFRDKWLASRRLD